MNGERVEERGGREGGESLEGRSRSSCTGFQVLEMDSQEQERVVGVWERDQNNGFRLSESIVGFSPNCTVVLQGENDYIEQ